MTIRDAQGTVDDKIPVKNVLVSVFDKTGLEVLIPGLVEAQDANGMEVMIMSTGGTYKSIEAILGPSAEKHLTEVAEYTQFPEMEGGLVKTLHPKIHAGILGERNNPAHQAYLQDQLGGAVYIDMVVVNLYPFKDIVSKIQAGEVNPKTGKPYDFESARGNIDIGGPAMIRGASKNFLGCAAVCDPADYVRVLQTILANDGCTTFDQRTELAPKAFEMSAAYDNTIARYMLNEIVRNRQALRNCYTFSDTR
ncbi:MAG TPA: hypothetical protein VJB08_05375 [Candidatus Nanoarchaeia archaeon]|nr:hypothetical protein [Candidatus Nanoarchaeia archaeon]